MSIFSNWTIADVALFNSKLRAARIRLLGEDVAVDIERGLEQCKYESDLHDEIEKELKLRGWYYVHSRMDCATTQAKGVPDFIIAAHGGKTFWIEAKGAKTKITPKQAGALAWLERSGHEIAIVRSMKEFLRVLNDQQIQDTK